jgi:hypothetical protein
MALTEHHSKDGCITSEAEEEDGDQAAEEDGDQDGKTRLPVGRIESIILAGHEEDLTSSRQSKQARVAAFKQNTEDTRSHEVRSLHLRLTGI